MLELDGSSLHFDIAPFGNQDIYIQNVSLIQIAAILHRDMLGKLFSPQKDESTKPPTKTERTPNEGFPSGRE